MTGLLPLLSLVCVAALVGTVCVFVRRLGVLLRAAADSVRAIAGDTHGMLSDSAGISPSIDEMNREDIEFKGEGGATLRGWFYPARNSAGPAPVIVLSHGLTAVKEMHIASYAEVFAEAGLNALVYDHQNFGDSDGSQRQEVDP